MSLHRQNKNGDFVYHIDFINAAGNVAPVPSSATIELSTENGRSSYKAEFKKDGESSGCKRSGDGLDVFIPLSRTPIGSGRMLAKITIHRESEDFPSGIQNICIKTTTNVLLWDGSSDDAISIQGEIILAE